MQHRLARSIIGLLTTERGFGDRSAAALHAGVLADRPAMAPLVDRLLEAITALPDAGSATGSSYTASSAMPGDLPGYYQRFGVVLVDHSRRPARHLELLYLVGQLWNHARRDERERLFVRWLDLVHGAEAPTGSWITRDDLRAWQRNQLTAHDDSDPTPDALAGMLGEDSPQAAYAILAQYLGFSTRIDELCRSLRVLVRSVALRDHDLDGELLVHTTAAACCERMVDEAPPDLLITMLSLLAHGIWFAGRAARQRQPAHGAASHAADLSGAIAAGDVTAAQAQARLSCADADRFWDAVATGLERLLATGGWLRGIRALATLHLVTGTDPVPSPDVAAAACAQLAMACHLADGSP